MNALFATAILALISPAKAPVTVAVNAKNGDVVSGERTFRVVVKANNAVTGVEFYVGDDLRDKDTSTPYEFTLDTVAETEGDLRLRFKAYTTEGESGEKAITVHIDNGISKGLDFHLQRGTAALQDGNYDVAITAARVALQINPKSTTARILAARAYLAKGTYDKAQKYAEDALADDAKNESAATLLSTIKLKQAFTTYSRDTDRKETLAAIKEALKSAVDTRRKVVDDGLDKVGAATAANLIDYSDAAILAQRYSLAVAVLDPVFDKDNRRVDVANRLAFAQMRLGKYADAVQTINQLKKNGHPDTYTDALMTVLYAEIGDANSSDAAMKDALISNPDDASIICAQAYVALKYYRHTLIDKTNLLLNYDEISGKDANGRIESRRVMLNALDQLTKSQGSHPEVLFYASALDNKLENFGASQAAFQQLVLADPLIVDAYIEQANRSIGATYNGKPTADENDQRLETAKTLYDAALSARPDSPQGLAGLSLVATIQRNYEEAIKWGEAAVKAAPSYPAGSVILGTAYNLAAAAAHDQADTVRKLNSNAGTTEGERQANEVKARSFEATASRYARLARDIPGKVAKLDPRLDGTDLTKPYRAWRYFYTGGRIPLLPVPH